MSRPTTYRFDLSTLTATHETHVLPSPHDDSRLSRPERWIGLLTTLRPGEGKSVVLFFGYAFLLLICYYILKTVREPLLLEGGSAELKSYAYAVIALVLLFMVPLYGVLFRRTGRLQLIRRITVFFISNLALFYVLGRTGIDIGFVYYVWVGVFGVTMVAQFWAHAAHAYKTESGQRLFPAIMAGAALGALAGPLLSRALFPVLGSWNMMAIAIALLLATLLLVERTSSAVPKRSRNGGDAGEAPRGHLLGGFALVMRDRYLLLLALLAVVLNCVNTTGEYILTDLVVRYADQQVALQPGLDKGDVIARFYGDYYFAVNALSLILQVGLVARVFRWIGVQGALVVLPVIALIGYGLVVFVPIFSVIRAVKILENSTDYSVMNTARHALYLPLPTAHQYEGKTAIDTFFWRFGDVLQAGVIYVGLNGLYFESQQFALLNMLLALIWILVALRIGKRYPGAAPAGIKINWRACAVGASTAVFAVAAFAWSAEAAAERTKLFTEHEPLAIELLMDMRALCRTPQRRGCEDVPATLVYKSADGVEQRVDALVRARGRWRNETGNCTVPPLFVFFRDATTAGTPFEGQKMLPLTTHCREKPGSYEQYVLKEYLAYRIYNLLTDKSLRVRLTRITYRDTGKRGRVVERFGFFTEHFESLAARYDAQLSQSDEFQPLQADPRELATLELFQYMIGNTDWSATHGHNVTHIRDSGGSVTAVPYDFDFSGLVNAAYAGPPPPLPIRSVTQRLFRGLCRPDFEWAALFAHFQSQQGAVDNLVEQIPDLEAPHRDEAQAYLEAFFDIVSSPSRQESIVERCRAITIAHD